MTDPAALLLLTSMGTVAVGALSIATLNAWQGWLDIRRMEIDPRRRPSAHCPQRARRAPRPRPPPRTHRQRQLTFRGRQGDESRQRY